MVKADVTVVVCCGLTTSHLHDVVRVTEAIHFDHSVCREVNKLRRDTVVDHHGLLELR